MYSSEDLKKAVEAVNSGRLSLREASKIYNKLNPKKHLIILIKGNQLNWCPITGAMTTLE